jgi:galactokinase
LRSIFSPYRICPIGAHVDHQGGVVLARTIELGTMLEYVPLNSNEIHLISKPYGEAKFRIGELDRNHWTRYAQAAALLLKAKRGMKAYVSGSMIGSGLSSSTSVGLAYLKALAHVNELELSTKQLVLLAYELEHGQLGHYIGLLDPLSIVHGRRDALLFIDTRAASITPIVDPSASEAAWIVAYSGVSRELTKSGYNIRVEECRWAASLLRDGAKILSDVPREEFEDKKRILSENLRKRAMHFYTEVERVHQGVQAWKNSNIELFGQLMNQSCESSIHNYESGSDILVELHELVRKTNGIYGSRFCGGGYGGCVLGLADKKTAESACLEIAGRFLKMHPELPSKVLIVRTGNGLQ